VFLFDPKYENNSSDSVKVVINNQLIDWIELDDTTNQNKWTQRIVDFEFTEFYTDENVLLQVRFSRETPSKQTTYFAVDNLQINYLGVLPIKTTHQTPETTTLITQYITSPTKSSIIPDASTENIPSVINVSLSTKTTDWVLGIFLPAILVSIIVLVVLFWKRSGEILGQLDTKRDETFNVKYSRDRTQVSFNELIEDQ